MGNYYRSLTVQCLLAFFLTSNYSTYSQVSCISLSFFCDFCIPNGCNLQDLDQYQQQHYNYYSDQGVVSTRQFTTDVYEQPLSTVIAQQGLPEGFIQQTVTVIKSEIANSNPTESQASTDTKITNLPQSDAFKFNANTNDHYWQEPPIIKSTTAIPEGRKISMNNHFARQYPQGMFHGSSSQRFTQSGSF